MGSILQSNLEYEKKITDFEEKFHIPRDTPGIEKQVVWILRDPTDLWPFIASLADEPESVNGDVVVNRKARSLPVMIGYSESVMIELSFDKPPKGKSFRALEELGIGKDAIVSAVSGGAIRLGSDSPPPFALESPVQCLNLLMALLIDEPDDLCQSLKFIRAEGPFEQIRGMKVIVRHNIGEEESDVAWLTLTGTKESDVKKAVSLVGGIHAPVIVPLVVLNGEHDVPQGDGTVDSRFPEVFIKDLEQSFEGFSEKTVYPPLPLRRTWHMQEAEQRSYGSDCLALIWETTRISGLSAAVDRRLQTVTDFVLEKPTGVLDMLRHLACLKELQSFPDFTAHYPDGDGFRALLRRGLDLNLVLSRPVEEEKGEKKIAAEPIPEAPTEVGEDSFIERAGGFLDELLGMDVCKAKQKELTRYTEVLDRERTSWNDEKRDAFVAGVDSIFEQVWGNLDNLDTTLKSALHDKETHLHSLEDSATSLVPEYIEKVMFFWGEFVQLSLKKIQLKPPADEVNEICSNAAKKFLMKLSHTPPDEGAFKKNMNSQWPVAVKNTILQINDLLNDTVQIWELKVNEGLTKLEEFRKKNLPKEPKIPTKISLKAKGKPVLEDVLNVRIKKQGLIRMFVSQSEKKEWKKETVGEISKHVKKIMKQYESDVLKWLKSLERNVHEYFTKIDKMGKNALSIIDEKKAQTGKADKEAELFQREIDTIEQNIDTLLKKKEQYHMMKQKWMELKKTQSS